MTQKNKIGGEVGWLAISIIIIVAMSAGMLYQQTQFNRPKTIKNYYNYCVKGCNLINQRDFSENYNSSLQNKLLYYYNLYLRDYQKFCEKEVQKNEIRKM